MEHEVDTAGIQIIYDDRIDYHHQKHPAYKISPTRYDPNTGWKEGTNDLSSSRRAVTL